MRIKDDVGHDRIPLVSAGIAFYGFLALFPALAAIISIWGLFADPAHVQQQIASLRGTLPSSAHDLLNRAAIRIASSSPDSLGWGVAISLALTLWSAKKGMKGLMQGITIAHRDDDHRGFLALNALAYALTVGAVVLAVVTIALVVALPVALMAVGPGSTTELIASLVRWPILAAIVASGLGVLYRFARPRRPRWRWATPGSIAATVLWLVASIGFSLYVQNFGSYNELYGSVAAVAILLMWLFISAFVVLLGAEIDAAAERVPARRGRPPGVPTGDIASTTPAH